MAGLKGDAELRDDFAGQILLGIVSREGLPSWAADRERMSREIYQMAQAMVDVRGDIRRKEGTAPARYIQNTQTVNTTTGDGALKR